MHSSRTPPSTMPAGPAESPSSTCLIFLETPIYVWDGRGVSRVCAGVQQIPGVGREYRVHDTRAFILDLWTPGVHSRGVGTPVFEEGPKKMPRYYCDYCGTYLTHDSAPGRRQHNRGTDTSNPTREPYTNPRSTP